MKDFLKKLYWYFTGKCPRCGTLLQVLPVGFGGHESYCTKCNRYVERF